MAAAGELKCIDSSPFRHLQVIPFERGTEKRDQGICRTKRCFCRPSYGIRYKFNVSAGPMVYVMVILRCSDWFWMYPIERRGIFFLVRLKHAPSSQPIGAVSDSYSD